MQKLTTWLWFDTEAEEAAEFYTSVFPDSRITDVTRYGEAGPRPAGMVMTVSFELFGREFNALNGGSNAKIEGYAVSFMVECDSQDELDGYWDQLAEGGQQIACGWVTDRYGVSWQIVPSRLRELLSDPDRERARRAMEAMLQMTKIEIGELERAAAAA
jgi:predicted 3-demethylubiquinone-9 3-methyltransferase (glyoxalase superfamily)